MELYGPVKLRGALADGTGDPLLTKDASTNSVGTTTNAFGNLQDGYILVGNISNEPTAVAVSGDVTITNAGVTSISAGVIVNADINASAAIAVSKLAAVTASRALVSDVSGFISASSVTATELGYIGGLTSSAQTQINSKQATITGAATTITSSDLTASRALVSGTTGKVEVSSVTSTALGYVANLTSDAQTQLNTKLAPTITGVATGDILYYNGTAWVNLPKGTDGQTLRSSSTTILWDTPTINGIPIGGTDGQALLKQSGTDFDANWETLSVSSITDLTATAAELNVLDGITATVTELNYTDGLSGPIQNQLDGKQSSTLPQNSLWVGNSSNLATTLSPGTSGYVLTSVSGVPTWQPVSASGTPPGSNTQVIFNDGGTFGADAGMTYNKTTDTLSTRVNLPAGTASAAPMKLATGTALTTPEDGAVEYHGSHLYFTIGSTRYQLDQQSSGITNSATLHEIMKSDGTNAVGSGLTVLSGVMTGLSGLNGSLKIGTVSGSTPSRRLHVEYGSNSLDPIVYPIRMSAVASDTPTAGYGVGIEFEAETASANYEVGAIIEAIISDVTAGSEDFDLVFKTMIAGAAPTAHLRMGSNKIGFLGATPVVRQVVPTGSSVDTVITALQNLGLFSQT